MFSSMVQTVPQIHSGKLRALGVSTKQRLQVLPDVPALAEFLPGYEATGWLGIGAPAGTPANVIDIVNKAVNAGLSDPKLVARMAALGAVRSDDSGSVQTIHRRRDREMGRGRQVRRHQGAVTAFSISAAPSGGHRSPTSPAALWSTDRCRNR